MASIELPNFREIDSDDEALDEASEGESDHESSDEREEYDVYSGESADEEVEVPEQSVFKSRDGTIQWYSTPPGAGARRRMESILRVKPGATRYAVSRINENPVSAFRLFITADIIRIIVENTNIQGRSKYKDNWIDVDNITIDAYFGFLFLTGVYNAYCQSTIELFDAKNRAEYRAAFSKQQFETITSCLRFDNRVGRDRRDKLAPFRDLYNLWNVTLRKNYNPHENLTIDEHLVKFRGRCPFRQYIPKKPGKYGIKVFALCDSKTKYCCNTDVYTGRNPDEPRETNQGKRVVLQLVSFLSSGYNITCDNFFVSYDLAVELLRTKHITMVGTVRKNKSFLPHHIVNVKHRMVETALFAFARDPDVTVTSYVPKKNRLVVLISTLHHDKQCHPEMKNKPEIISFYNNTKSGVDNMDQLVNKYTCKRKSNRWPMALFSSILDISAYNAFVLYMECNANWPHINKKYRRREFLKELGRELLEPQIARRKKIPTSEGAANLVKEVREKMMDVDETNEPSTSTGTTKSASKRKRCFMCKDDNKYFETCTICHRTVCKKHSNLYCLHCLE